MYNKITALCVVLIILVTESNLCSIDICFNWKITTNALILKCKVPSVIHRLMIINQFDKILADCVPPPTTAQNCASDFKNGSIRYDAMSNETIFTMTGTINHHLNGNWTCRHGTSLDIAQVEVTVIIAPMSQEKLKELNQGDLVNNKTRKGTQIKSCDRGCITLLFSWTFGSFILSLVICLTLYSVINFRDQSLAEVVASQTYRILNCITAKCTCGFTCIQRKKPRSIFVLQNILIVILVSIVFILAGIVGHLTENDCTIQTVPTVVLTVVFTVLGIAGGFFSSLLINKNEGTQNQISTVSENNQPPGANVDVDIGIREQVQTRSEDNQQQIAIVEAEQNDPVQESAVLLQLETS
ncbi:uncharacterized protein LOC127705325 isoform X2 [Mytilus californianus]|uniref:uncharacterized protein LOC127705325 isoform X2 n=1 Tax=Mytilus californianus TaxID=6549 RepID=UPI002247C05B|nr:uncharacterized protein LOC127705325 isoform X2 [Mytilus californianus]